MAAKASPRPRRPPGLRLERLLTITDETDETGRLLLEDSAPSAAQRKVTRSGVDMTAMSCPYRDTPSRLGGQMNGPAYEAFRRDLKATLDGFAWLWQGYRRTAPGRAATVEGLVDIAKLGLDLPLVLVHRAHDPIDRHGALPSFVGAMFKASRGVFSAAFAMSERHHGPATAAEVIAFADANGHLTRPDTNRVCAAPTRLMERTIAVMLTGEGADGGASSLGDLADYDTVWGFYDLEQALNHALGLYRSLLEQAMSARRVRHPRELFGMTVTLAGRRRRFGDLTQDCLDAVNGIQQQFNRLLGRDERARPLTFEDLLQAL